MIGIRYWDIPATVSVKLDSAELIFTTLVAGEPCGEGRKQFHHKDLSDEGAESSSRPQRWRFCPFHGTVHVLDEDADDELGHGFEEGMETLNLCGY